MDKTQFGQFGAPSTGAPNIDPLDYPSEVCPNCGCEVFVPGVIMKKVPGVLLGAPTETVDVPVKVFVCAKCHTLSPTDQEILDKSKKATETAKKSNLII